MKFNKLQFVYIDINYLEYLHEIEPEIFFNKEDRNYIMKPHIGILLNNDGIEYVIPLTSAKNKHKNWADVTSDWYRIYEIINTKEQPITEDDIVVDIKNDYILKNIPKEELPYTKQRILSIIDMRKMFPVDKSVYTPIVFKMDSNTPNYEKKRIFLMLKEYNFIEKIVDDIERKASKIYNKQISKNKVLKYQCDFKKLEDHFKLYKNTINPTPQQEVAATTDQSTTDHLSSDQD